MDVMMYIIYAIVTLVGVYCLMQCNGYWMMRMHTQQSAAGLHVGRLELCGAATSEFIP